MAAKIILVKRTASPLRKGAPMGNQNARKDGGGQDKWFRRVLTDAERKKYIGDVRSGKDSGNALIGEVSLPTMHRIKELTGIEVTKIVLEKSAILHSDSVKHKLELDDIEKSVDVINNPVDIKLSSEKTKQGLQVVVFEGNIDGKIFFAETVQKKYGGVLSLKTAYRPNKASSVRQWNNTLDANVQNAPLPASPTLSPKTSEKSSGKKAGE